jgi:hypothetical protein
MATQYNSPIRVTQLRTDNIEPSTISGPISISTPSSMSIVATSVDFDADIVFNRQIDAAYIEVDSGIFTGSFNGTLVGTASWSSNAATASFAPNYVLISQTGSLVALSSSFASTASYINPTFISASAAASGFGSGGGGSATLIDTIGFRIYTDDTYITSGLKSYKHIGYNSTITKTRSIANTNGYIDINVKRNGSTLGTISLSNQSASLDTTLTGWTTALNTDDLLEFHVSQSSTYITDISIFIDIQSQ